MFFTRFNIFFQFSAFSPRYGAFRCMRAFSLLFI